MIRIVKPETAFWWVMGSIATIYLLFWGALLGATTRYTNPDSWWHALASPDIRHAIWLSLVTSTTAAAFALALAIPISYLLSRKNFPGKAWVDAALDIPIVLPPMVVGLCLLIFFQTTTGRALERVIPFTYTVAGVILAQFTVAAAFAIRSLRGTFDQMPRRPEDVALTLGATPWQAFRMVALPGATKGMMAAFCIAWARSIGEFGPILVFAGATRRKTEVLPTTVWLELSVGNLEAAVAVSLLMIVMAIIILVALRLVGQRL